MAKLYHFTNSKVSNSNFEPIHSELFDVVITPPDSVIASTIWTNNQIFLHEEIKGISGLKVDIMPDVVTQTFKGAKRNFIGVVPNDTSVKFSIDFELNLNDSNQDFVYNIFRKWSDLQYDPLTATQSLKRDYVSLAGISMTAFNKVFDQFRKIEIKNVMIASDIPVYDKAYGGRGNGLHSFKMDFIGDYFNYAFN